MNEISGNRLAATREWLWIEAHLRQVEKDLLEEALSAETIEDLAETAGRVYMLRDVLALPEKIGEPE